MTATKELLARWESRSGKHFCALYIDTPPFDVAADYDGYGATYEGNGCGGFLGSMTKDRAIAIMQARVDSGYFLPDAAKTPMKRVK